MLPERGPCLRGVIDVRGNVIAIFDGDGAIKFFFQRQLKLVGAANRFRRNEIDSLRIPANLNQPSMCPSNLPFNILLDCLLVEV